MCIRDSIVSILIKRTFFISYTHQAVKEIIIQIIGFTCHMVHNPAKISLFIIGISIQLLLCSAGRFSEIAFCHPVLTVVGVPDLISICINLSLIHIWLSSQPFNISIISGHSRTALRQL